MREGHAEIHWRIEPGTAALIEFIGGQLYTIGLITGITGQYEFSIAGNLGWQQPAAEAKCGKKK
jgi:hypothetical protein